MSDEVLGIWALHARAGDSSAVNPIIEEARRARESEATALDALESVRRTCQAVMRREAPIPSMALSGAIDVADDALRKAGRP